MDAVVDLQWRSDEVGGAVDFACAEGPCDLKLADIIAIDLAERRKCVPPESRR